MGPRWLTVQMIAHFGWQKERERRLKTDLHCPGQRRSFNMFLKVLKHRVLINKGLHETSSFILPTKVGKYKPGVQWSCFKQIICLLMITQNIIIDTGPHNTHKLKHTTNGRLVKQPNKANLPCKLGLFILCSHLTTMATWRATNADKMASNSGQPGELQPCRFPILQKTTKI